MVRLQKYISDCGYTSRRKAEELIISGVVTVNGIVASLGDKVDENTCTVRINNKLIRPQERKVYIVLNKPAGYLSSVTDDRGRKTVTEIIRIKERIFPVGRLDYDTEGLLLLTNDGDFTYKVTHPKHNIQKTYIATVNGTLETEDINKLKTGVEIEDYFAKADYIKINKVYENKSDITITISQGKNRQVRKMFEAIGYKVIALKRISIGGLKLENLKPGEWKFLSREEIKKIGVV